MSVSSWRGVKRCRLNRGPSSKNSTCLRLTDLYCRSLTIWQQAVCCTRGLRAGKHPRFLCLKIHPVILLRLSMSSVSSVMVITEDIHPYMMLPYVPMNFRDNNLFFIFIDEYIQFLTDFKHHIWIWIVCFWKGIQSVIDNIWAQGKKQFFYISISNFHNLILLLFWIYRVEKCDGKDCKFKWTSWLLPKTSYLSPGYWIAHKVSLLHVSGWDMEQI